MPDEDEIRTWVAKFEADRRQIEATQAALDEIGTSAAAALATVQTAFDVIANPESLNPTIDISSAMWEREDPSGAKREAFRRVHGIVPSMPFEMYLPLFGAKVPVRIPETQSGSTGDAEVEACENAMTLPAQPSSRTIIETEAPSLSLAGEIHSAEASGATAGNLSNASPIVDQTSDHLRRVTLVEKQYSPHAHAGKPAFKRFYEGIATPSEFSAWKRGDRQHCGKKIWKKLDEAADRLDK